MIEIWLFFALGAVFVVVGGLWLAFFLAQRPNKRKFPWPVSTQKDRDDGAAAMIMDCDDD